MLPEYYQVLTNTDAVDIYWDAKELFGKKKYAISAYQAFVAQQVFKKYGNKEGVFFSQEIIDDAIRKLRSKIMKRVGSTTLFNLSKVIACSEEVRELGECFKDELKQGKLEEVVCIYNKLVDGESFDPFEDGLFSDN